MGKPKGKKIGKWMLLALAAVLVVCAGFVGSSLLTERPAVAVMSVYQETFADTVITEETDGAVEIFPTADDRKTGIIFYVGAQITPDAYTPLLAELAEAGYACFIPKLNCNMASMEPGAAEAIISEHPEIGAWYIAGHSMGGLTASGFAADHLDEVDGLILIASYTNRDLTGTTLPVLSIYGDADGVLNKELYDKRLSWYPKNFEEHIIAGANHAQYGDYGEQPRDKEALISAEEQRRQTADIILNWLERYGTDR